MAGGHEAISQRESRMIFNSLMEAIERNELILVAGGMCHYHLRRDGQLTILEIIVLPQAEGSGVAYAILNQLKAKNPASIFAKCPVDLERANGWYLRQGFTLERVEFTRTGRVLNCWRR